MDKRRESYTFPVRTISKLQFDRVFAECVGIVRPRLVVALGAPTAKYLAADPARAKTRTIDVGTPNGTLSAETLVTAIVPHPSAWVGVTNAYFEPQGRRIGDTYNTAMAKTDAECK